MTCNDIQCSKYSAAASYSKRSNFLEIFFYLLLFLFLLFLLLEGLCSFVGSYQLSEVSDILVSLLQQIGQALILLLVNQFTVALFIFSLRKQNRWKWEGLYTELS